MHILQAIVAAMSDISKIGIGKTTKNTAQNYWFRGIDAAMNEMAPILIRHGITITPHYSDIVITEQPREGKGPMRFCTLKGRFTFSTFDAEKNFASEIASEYYGEAMDSGDKAVTKAQSVAFRTALFQQFVVPTMAIDPEDGGSGDELLDEAHDKALQGTKVYSQWFTKTITADQRKHLKDNHASLKDAAAKADADKAAWEAANTNQS